MGLGIERRLKKELVKFARNHDNIVGITKGGNSEEGHEVYYFIVKGSYDDKFEDEISKLDLYFHNKDFGTEVATWPCSYETVKDYVTSEEFLGEILWERE